MKKYFVKNRYTVLLATLTIYLLVMVLEGQVTGRKAQVFDFENPFFDFKLNNIDQFIDLYIEQNPSE